MTLPSPKFQTAPIPDSLKHVRGFHDLQTYFPTLSKLFRITKHQSNTIWLDSKYRVSTIDISGTSGLCSVGLTSNTPAAATTEEQRKQAYLKVTHLLDPIRWMKGEYSLPKQVGLPWHSKTWANAWTKLQDPTNQAYIEVVASYAVGRLRELDISPHFNEFYGGFCARADTYRYNLTEEFKSFRNTRWFWHGQKRGLYKLHVGYSNNPNKSVTDDVLNDIIREPSIVADDSASEEEIDVDIVDDNDGGSLHSDKMSDISFAEENESDMVSDDTEIEDKYRIYSEISDFPVMMIALENNDGTMDSLLDDYSGVGATPGTEEWEDRWSAWIFQVLAALSVAQSIIGLTHNDLHTNNIVWTKTEEEFLYYTKQTLNLEMMPMVNTVSSHCIQNRSARFIQIRPLISHDLPLAFLTRFFQIHPRIGKME